MNKTRDEMIKLDEEVELNIYNINQAISIGNEISQIATEIRMARQVTEEGILEEEKYKDYTKRRLKDIKNLVAQVYGNMGLDKIESNFDKVFEVKGDE